MPTIMEALGGNSGETIMEAFGGEKGQTIAEVIEKTGLKPATPEPESIPDPDPKEIKMKHNCLL